MTKEHIKENLMGPSGKLIHQRIKNLNYTIEDLYCIYKDTAPSICEKCGKHRKFISFNKGYSNKCSNKKCNVNMKHIYDYSDNEIEKYITNKGLDSNFSAKCFESAQEIYNYFYKTQSPKCSLCHSNMKFISFNLGYSEDKCINTNCNNIKAKTKREETCQSKYGDRHFNNRALMKKTKLERYGDEKYTNTKQAKETKKLRYGNENFVNIEKRKQTVKRLKKSNISRSKLYPKFNLHNLNKKYIEENFVKNGLFMSEEFMNYFNCKETWMNVKLRELDVYIEKREKIEEKINKEFDNIFIVRDKNIIKPLEIDLLNVEYKFGIEYNGLIWHSYGKSSYNRFDNHIEEDYTKYNHLNKTNLMEDKGYQLFHIFENEWLDKNKKSIWTSIIKDKLNKNKKISVRECTIKEVSVQEARIFIDENHLQGYIRSKIKIGLYYKGELISIMTFRKTRPDRDIEYELVRLCAKKGYSIQGGYSMLLEYFEKEYKPKSLISYANRRWTSNTFYEENGLEFAYKTGPKYFYFLPNKRELFTINKYQKDKVKELVSNYDYRVNETENMYNNGYRKIYDSGDAVYIKIYQN